jgi:hypothetical protein
MTFDTSWAAGTVGGWSVPASTTRTTDETFMVDPLIETLVAGTGQQVHVDWEGVAISQVC